MKVEKYTFWNIINNFVITVPIIQRDYAQGRESEKIEKIRNNFLDDIYVVISDLEKTMDLDFVYGSVSSDKKQFIPLDGQQRLTTLFLLHWYFAVKENQSAALSILKNFRYETRISSTDFVSALVNYAVKIPNKNTKLSDLIQDSSWFFLSWQRDPTVRSMLVMLDAIHKRFFDCNNNVFFKLIDDKNPVITFQFIELNNFGLTDSLYVKMNARGKTLTDFENFKAKFEQFLEENHPEKQEEFSRKIDSIWVDGFWEYREEKVIDKAFMRFFYFLIEMLFFLNQENNNKESPFIFEKENPVIDYSLIELVCKNEEVINFIFSAFDLLYVDGNYKLKEIVDSVFCGNEHKKDKVALFEVSELFEKSVSNKSFGIYEKILLFTVIYYLVKIGNAADLDNLKDIIRVVRNLLLRVRSLNKNECKFDSNLRYQFLSYQLNDICNVLISNENVYTVLSCKQVEDFNGFNGQKYSIETEREKAQLIVKNQDLKKIIFKLEDHPSLKGAIHNFSPKENAESLEYFVTAFYKIWSNTNDSLIIRSLLSVSDYPINMGWSSLGDRYFFGGMGKWHTTLTAFYENCFIPVFLNSYKNNNESLQSIIDNSLENIKGDWRYYFVKYESMTNVVNSVHPIKNKLYSRWWNSNFRIRLLTKSRLSGWHINPYIMTVVEILQNDSICSMTDCYSDSSDESPLFLKKGVNLHCKEDGWEVKLTNNIDMVKFEEVKGKFFIENNYLKPTEKMDMIEVAVDFICELYQLENPLDKNKLVDSDTGGVA